MDGIITETEVQQGEDRAVTIFVAIFGILSGLTAASLALATGWSVLGAIALYVFCGSLASALAAAAYLARASGRIDSLADHGQD